MDQKSMRLPIRFVEDRWDSFVFLFMSGALGLWIYMDIRMFHSLMWGDLRYHALNGIFWLVLVGQAVLLVVAINFLLLPVLLSRFPGGPYYYTEIGREMIGARKGWRLKRFKWDSLSAFSVYREDRFRKGSRTTYYWVVARARRGAPGLDEEAQRPVLKLLALDFGVDDNNEDAVKVADWLNRLRDEAVAGGGVIRTEIIVPAPFRDAAESVADRRAASSAADSAVVER